MFLERVRAATDRSGSCDELDHRLAAARLRADAVVGEGAGAAAGAVRGRRRGRHGRARARRSTCSSRQPLATEPRQLAATFQARLDDVSALRRRLPALLLARRRGRRPEARALPPACERERRPRRQAPLLAHGAIAKLAAERRGVDPDDRQRRRRHRPTLPRAAGNAVVERADGSRRRGHGRQADGLHRRRAARRRPARPEGAAGGSTCASSTGPSTPSRRTSTDCGSAASAASGRSPSREFALGVEALERFVREEPLRRVHECCFGVLALESEPVDPRL